MAAVAVGSLVLPWVWVPYQQFDTIPFSRFEQLVAEGGVTEVTVSSDTIQGKREGRSEYAGDLTGLLFGIEILEHKGIGESFELRRLFRLAGKLAQCLHGIVARVGAA